MTARRAFPPKRRMRQEILALIPVAAALAGAMSAFPRDLVLSAVRDAPAATPASCAFVVLDKAAEAAAMEDVRSALSVDAASVRNLRTDLSLPTIADEKPEPLVDVDSRHPAAGERASASLEPPLPPSAAAPEPAALREDPADATRAAEPFPRGELLRPAVFE